MSHPREKRLVHPRLQGRLLLLLMAACGVSVLVHAALSAWALSSLAAELPNDGMRVRDALPGTLVLGSLTTLLLVLPLFLLLGLGGSFRVFGPLHRFRLFLEDVAEGRHPGPCEIRGDDELQELCRLLNAVTEPNRTGTEQTTGERPSHGEAA